MLNRKGEDVTEKEILFAQPHLKDLCYILLPTVNHNTTETMLPVINP